MPPYVIDWDIDGTGDFDDAEDLFYLTPGNYILVLSDIEGCMVRDTFEITSEILPDIDNPVDVNLYPNPSSNFIQINIEDDFSYKIISDAGEIVRKGQRINGDPISVLGLTQGSCLVRIRRADRTGTVKIIKL